MPSLRRAEADVFKQQADATVTEASPVSGTKYTVLDTTKNVRIISMAVKCTFATCDPLEIHVTIDGQTITFTTSAATTNTWNYPSNSSENAETAQTLQEATDYAAQIPFLREGRSVKVEVEATGGTLSDLTARVKYAVIP